MQLFHDTNLTFEKAASALQAYEMAKTDSTSHSRAHAATSVVDVTKASSNGSATAAAMSPRRITCLPEEERLALPRSRPLRIAVFVTASRDSRNLFGDTYDAESQAQYDHAYDLSLEDKRSYANRHGYDFFVFDQVVEGRTVGWSRVPAALSLLQHYDWLFYIDLDTVIVDHSVRLEEFVDPRYDLVIGVDMNGINTGVFFLRNSTWSRLLYAEAWTRTEERNSHVWFEQAALMALMAEGHGIRNHMKLVPQEVFNTYLGPAEAMPKGQRPFIVHFAGRGDKWSLVERLAPRKERK